MKKLLIILLCVPIFSFAGLYDLPTQSEPPTYTVNELNTAFQHLQTYYGACTVIFINEGVPIELCDVVKTFTKAIEQRSIQGVLDNPGVSEGMWSNGMFAIFQQAFPSSRWAGMFAGLTQPQLNIILQQIIYWNPDFDGTRTFEEFKTAILGE